MGIDYGDTNIGIALSSQSGITAYGHTTLRRGDPAAFKPIMAELRKIIKANDVTHIVLGMPLNLDGSLGSRAEATLYFKEKLGRHFKNKPVILWDERFSTKVVGLVSKNRKSLDEMAAVYILQGYLDKIGLEEFMENDHMNDDDAIVLVNDDGEEIPLSILTSRDCESGTYVLAAEENEEGEAAIFKCIPDGEEEIIFELVDGEHEDYKRVLVLFREDFETLGISVEEDGE